MTPAMISLTSEFFLVHSMAYVIESLPLHIRNMAGVVKCCHRLHQLQKNLILSTFPL